jgi:hypothetical protein
MEPPEPAIASPSRALYAQYMFQQDAYLREETAPVAVPDGRNGEVLSSRGSLCRLCSRPRTFIPVTLHSDKPPHLTVITAAFAILAFMSVMCFHGYQASYQVFRAPTVSLPRAPSLTFLGMCLDTRLRCRAVSMFPSAQLSPRNPPSSQSQHEKTHRFRPYVSISPRRLFVI